VKQHFDWVETRAQ